MFHELTVACAFPQLLQGIPRALLGHSIAQQGLRPTFPPDTPFEWQFLACRCWETDPAIR